MSLCRSNILSSWSQPSRALVIQWMAPEWHVNLYALTDNLTWYRSSLLCRQSALRGRGVTQVEVFWWQSAGPEGMKEKVWLGFSGNSWIIKENLGSNFTLEVFIFRKAEHRQPIKICVHWGIPVSWHDNLLFKCTAAFLPFTTEQSRQLIHYHWASFLSPSHHSPFCSLCSCPTVETLLCSAAEPTNCTGQRATTQVRVSVQLFTQRWTSREQICGGVIGGG